MFSNALPNHLDPHNMRNLKRKQFCSHPMKVSEDLPSERGLRELCQYPLLSHEEQRPLFEEYASCIDPLRRKALAEEVLKQHVKYIVKIAGRYHRGSGGKADLVDLVQAGCIGLLKALKQFDLKKNVEFITYIGKPLAQAMEDVLRTSSALPKQRRYQEVEREILKLVKEHKDAHNPFDTVAQVLRTRANTRTITPQEIEEIYRLRKQSVSSLEGAVFEGEDGSEKTLYDLLPNEAHVEAEALNRIARTTLRDYLKKTLGEREYMVIAQHYGFDGEEKSFAQIAREIGVSREWIRKIAERAHKKIQEFPPRDLRHLL